jgi:16S rRNA (cytidine1402-2'-O)-methyltransferase
MPEVGKLYVVALPIGNLKDITLRALEVLKSEKYIICEDTRAFKKLINHYKLGEKKLISFYKNVEKKKTEKLIEILEKGEDVVLVSEAGTPGISDPGAYLIKLCYEKGIKVIPVPGVSALTCALSVSGINLNKGFIFLGFLPRKKAEQKEILENLPEDLPIIIFEAPHRFSKTLKNLLEILGDRKCFLARELTKMHEELLWTNLKELSERKEFLGEITLIIMPEEKKEDKDIDLQKIKNEAKKLKREGLKTKDIVKSLAKKYNLSTKFLYDLLKKTD